MERKLLVVVLCLLGQGCGGSSGSDNSSNEVTKLFPSLLVDKRCFLEEGNSVDTWFSLAMEFDELGYLAFGKAYYIDQECEDISHFSFRMFSTYPYRIGGVVKNSDGSSGTELLFPDPEGAGRYGSVVLKKNEEVCFANGTLEQSGSATSFIPVDNEGDFRSLEIDYENCLSILYQG